MSEELQQTSAQSLYLHADEKLIETIKNKLPTEEELFDLSELFKVFGDSTRIKILMTLLESAWGIWLICSHRRKAPYPISFVS